MNNIDNKVQLSKTRTPWVSVFYLLLYMLGGYFVAQFFGLLVLLAVKGTNLEAISEIYANPSDESNWLVLILLQGVVSVVAFIITPWLYQKNIEGRSFVSLFNKQASHLTPVVLTIAGVIAFMLVNTLFIEWNQNVDFPEFMSGFERWAQSKEATLKAFTEMLTTFRSFGAFLTGLLVMAVIPAIGEEYLFRGLLQNHLHRLTKNVHLAIWITAFIFGFIHLQFYGMIPRMLLGALFGYMYYWSGSLLIPILAHFVNNGLTIILLYSYQKGLIEYNVEETETLSWNMLLPVLLVGIASLWYLRNYFLKQDKEPHVS